MRKLIVDQLEAGMIPAKTIYSSTGMVLVAKGVPLKPSYIESLRKFAIREVMIKEAEDEKKYYKDFGSAAQQAVAETKRFLDVLEGHGTLKIADNVFKVEQMIYSVLVKPAVQDSLAHIANSEKVYYHSLRTTLLALNMALCKGYDYLNLEFIAICALLHDSGLLEDCNEEEEHSLSGFVKLRENPELDMVVALTCLQHHEHFDGTGKPFGFSKMQITEFARLIAVASYYDELVFSKKNSPRQAVFKVIQGSGRQFDPDMVKLFTKIVAS